MYAELESDVSEWFLNVVKTNRKSQESKVDTSGLTPHQKLVEFLARNEVLDKTAPLQLIYNEIIRRSLVHQGDIALRFVEQWTAYRNLINKQNLQRIKAQESMIENFFDKFIGGVTFNTALNNQMYNGSRYAPEFDTLIVAPPLVPVVKGKRSYQDTFDPREDETDDEKDITKYVELLFTQAMAKAHIAEMSGFVTGALDSFISGCISAISDARHKVSTSSVTEDEGDSKHDDLEHRLTAMITDTVQQWDVAFKEADPDSKETQLALSKARDDADRLSSQHLELLVKDEKAMLYLHDYENELIADGVRLVAQPVIDVIQSCRTAYSDNIRPPVLLDWRKPGSGKRQRVKEEVKEVTELTWLATSQGKLEAKLLDLVVSITPYKTQREAARKSALMLDYAMHLLKLDFASPAKLIQSIRTTAVSPVYVKWVLDHEKKYRERAREAMEAVRKQMVEACDLASGRIISIRDYFVQQVELAKRTRQSADADLQVTIKGRWKILRVTSKQRGELIQIFVESKLQDSTLISGETINQIESTLQVSLLKAATLMLIT